MPELSSLNDLPEEAQTPLIDFINSVAKHTIPYELRKVAEEGKDFIIYGPASVEVVDKEGDLILADALKESLPQLLRRARLSLSHEDNLVGEILPEYTSKNGVTYKTEVVNDRLMLVANVWDDTHDSKDTRMKIDSGQLRSFSISGKALEARLRIDKEGNLINEIRRLDLSAVTVCPEGMNPEARFKVIAKQRIVKPFAGYKDFAACVSANQSKVSDPEAYCAAIHHRATGKWPSEKMEKYWTATEKSNEEVKMTEEETKEQEDEKPQEEATEATADAIQDLAGKINSLAEDLDKLKLAVYSKADEEAEEEEEEEEKTETDIEKKVEELVAKKVEDIHKKLDALTPKTVQKAETPRPAAEPQAPMTDTGISLDVIQKAVAGKRIGDFSGIPDVHIPNITR